MNEYKMSKTESICLAVNLLCSKLFLLTPAFFVSNSGSGAMLTVLWVYGLAFLFFFFFRKRTGGNLFCALSKPVLQAFHIISLLLVLFCCIIHFSLLVYFIKLLAFPRAPFLYLAIPFGAACIFCAANGLPCVAKLHGFFVPLLYGCLLLLVLANFKSFDCTGLFPLFGKGFLAVFGKGFFMLSSLFEVLLLFYMTEHTKISFPKFQRPALLLSMLLYLSVIGAFLISGGTDKHIPMLSVIRSGFFGRFDAVFLLLYALSGMLYLSAMLCFSTLIFQKAFRLPTAKPLSFPFGLFVIAMSEIPFLNPAGQAFLKNAGAILWLFPFLLPFVAALFYKRRHHS